MQCRIVNELFQTWKTLLDSDKCPRDYGTGDLLYHAEVNLLEAIYRYPDANPVELSKRMEITRGAVTQLGNKLEQKKMIEKLPKQGNKKEKVYALTPLGERARQGHQAYHALANQQICHYLSTLREGEVNVISDFLQKIAAFHISEFDCSFSEGCLIYKEGGETHA